MSFDGNLNYGKAAESAIAKWLRSRGHGVIPAYEKILDTGKGPQVYMPESELIAPDLLVFKEGNALWVEAKHKKAFSWYRVNEKLGRNPWVTGIDKRHYEHYLRINNETPWQVVLMFLHEGGQAKDSPAHSPSGLYARRIRYLSRHIDHESDKYGPTGMVYWCIDDLKKLASLEDIY